MLEVELADSMPDGWELWLEWQKVIAPDNQSEIEAIQTDRGKNLGYVRAFGYRKDDGTWKSLFCQFPLDTQRGHSSGAKSFKLRDLLI